MILVLIKTLNSIILQVLCENYPFLKHWALFCSANQCIISSQTERKLVSLMTKKINLFQDEDEDDNLGARLFWVERVDGQAWS